jgi:hypothetical protein
MTITLGKFRVGATFGGLAYLTTLGLVNPRAATPSYSRPTILADGTLQNFGWLQCVWEWTYLNAARYTILRTYFPNQSGAVFISTFDDTLAWRDYQCIYRFPTPLPESMTTRRGGITIQLVDMVDMTPA